jgi:hypothetical protein
MSRLVFILALATTVMVALVATSGGQGAPADRDLVAGTAWDFNNTMVHVNAKSDEQGARGHFFIRTATSTVQGTVSCVEAVGPFAAVAGQVTKASGFLVPPSTAKIVVRDFGEPGTSDGVTYTIGPAPPDCGIDGTGGLPIQRGNYIVRDGFTQSILDSLQPQIAALEDAAGPH